MDHHGSFRGSLLEVHGIYLVFQIVNNLKNAVGFIKDVRFKEKLRENCYAYLDGVSSND